MLRIPICDDRSSGPEASLNFLTHRRSSEPRTNEIDLLLQSVLWVRSVIRKNMKSNKSLRRQQEKMRSRNRKPRLSGRPKKTFTDKDEERIWKLLEKGYKPKEIAVDLGVSLRTLGKTYPYLVPETAKNRGTREKLLRYQRALAGEFRCIRACFRESGVRLKAVGSFTYIPQDY